VGGRWTTKAKLDTYIADQRGNHWSCFVWQDSYAAATTATDTKTKPLTAGTACGHNVLVVAAPVLTPAATADTAGAHTGDKALAVTSQIIKFQTSWSSDDWSGAAVRFSPDEGVKMAAYFFNYDTGAGTARAGAWQPIAAQALKGSLSGLATSCIAAGALIANMF